MNTDIHRNRTSANFKDAVVFVVTVAFCSLLLAAGHPFTKATRTTADTIFALAMPQPPLRLGLAAEPEPALPGIKLTLARPAIEMVSAFPEIEMVFTFSELNLTPAGAKTIAKRLSVSTGTVPPKPMFFHGIITQVAGRYEVDPHLIRAIILAESGYNPKAKSKKGARGLMQLMPSTAKSLGVQDIYDPEQNIDGGVRYFRSLLDRFNGDVQLALAAYNAGSRHVRNYEGIPPFKATRHYIKKVLKFHEKFKTENDSRKLS